MVDSKTVERLKQVASSYIAGSFGAKMEDGFPETKDGLLFGYHFNRASSGDVSLPGDGGTLLVRWDGVAVDMPTSLSDAFELPLLPV